jgi:hypothetical protein
MDLEIDELKEDIFCNTANIPHILIVIIKALGNL